MSVSRAVLRPSQHARQQVSLQAVIVVRLLEYGRMTLCACSYLVCACTHFVKPGLAGWQYWYVLYTVNLLQRKSCGSAGHCSHHMKQCVCIACCDECETCCSIRAGDCNASTVMAWVHFCRVTVGSNTLQTNFKLVEQLCRALDEIICDSLVQSAVATAPCTLCLLCQSCR